MTDSEISALAREYAEENVKQPEDMSNSLHNEYLKLFAHEAEELIRFLLRRYCLVDKSKVKAKHKEALAALESNDNEDAKWGTYRLSLLESLFPEIAKEVEE